MYRLKMVLPNCKAYYGAYTHNIIALQFLKERLEEKYRDRLFVIVSENDKPIEFKFKERALKVKQELTPEEVKRKLRRL